jgi:hypothetical protein
MIKGGIKMKYIKDIFEPEINTTLAERRNLKVLMITSKAYLQYY